MKKEIKFSAKLDSAEFDRSVDQMQRKLKDMYAPADQVRQQTQWSQKMGNAGIPGASAPTQDAYQRATQQSRREMDQFLATEVKRQDQLSKNIEKRVEKIKELQKQQAELVKGSEEELKVKEKISKMSENNYRLREIERGRSQAINQTFDARDKITPNGFGSVVEGFKSGGIRGAANAGMDLMKNMSPTQMAGMIGTVLTVTGMATKLGGELYNSYKNAPIATASNYGSAMTGVMGREVNAAYSGRSGLEMAFLPEKQRALAMAGQGMKGERVNNVTSAAGSMLGYAGVGAGIGAGIGAVGGLGVGSWLTAPIGAGIGAVGGLGYGAYKSMTGEGGGKSSALMKGAFSSTHNAEYESMMAKEFADKYSTSLQGLKEQNPYKTAAAEQYDGNYTRYLDSQRSMGLNNANFHGSGGFRSNAINAGFTDDMAMGASSNILGAGGSTRMARNSVFAMQAGRQFDQTNSAGVLGQLSGNLGSSQASQQAYIKMLAEGTRLGLDSSEYREESRKMMEATAGVITRSGAGSSTDIDRIVSQMGGFLAEKTNKGVQSAKEAFEYYNQASGETGGARGTMRAAGFMQDKLLGKMDAFERSGVASMTADQLSTDDPMLQSLAKKYGTTPEEIIKSVNQVNKKSFNYRPSTDKAMDTATSLKEQISKLAPGDPKREELQGQLSDAMGELNTGLAVDNPGMSRRTRMSMAEGMTSQEGISQAIQDSISGKMGEKGGTGRIEDQSVAGAAEGSRVVLENFVKFKDQLVPTADAIREFNKQIAETVAIIDKMNGSDKAKYMEKMGFGAPQTQSQSGKSGK